MSFGEQQENKNLAYYCKVFSELNVSSSRQRGAAHYKPILLLSVIDLISQELITDNRIAVSEDLIETFEKYWNILASASYKGGLHYPFFHLQSDDLGWELTFKSGFNGLQPKTTNKLKEAVEYAKLDEPLFDLLQDPLTRTELIDCLIASWFSSNRRQIEDIIQINQDFQSITQEQIGTESKNFDEQPKIVLRKSVIRNAFFRKAIVHIYDYKCAFCRLRVMRTLTQNIVDGAHIKPFAQFFDSRINNGLSFCKNHHWAFDQGWFGIDDEYRIIVADDLQEESPNAKPMEAFQNEHILLPSSEKYFPSLEALQWHKRNVFKA
ncbi:HNH endonuclease [Argonema antarcticum]|uniref:HNH endonuclease n=1 Tax=Argonema antarcticum TaxID=2942763 RepID=UPI0020135DC1|nr:HNH endonuclease [Argonema antarcticum]MCL1475428.1 HNH endonuclease [Argonema antarcticum A004/B2]